MTKVFFSVTMSLDGFIAPEARFDDVGDKRWMNQWMELQRYIFQQRFFRELLKLGDGGLEGDDNRVLEEVVARTGVSIMGKRMFDGGEQRWPEEAPFHTPFFVLTRQKREPWVRPGGTTFHFVNDGPGSALEQAREAAGDRDIRIPGGADVIQQYLNLGVVEELEIAIAPVLFGGGRRLFENLREPVPRFRIDRVVDGPDATHVRYVRA